MPMAMVRRGDGDVGERVVCVDLAQAGQHALAERVQSGPFRRVVPVVCRDPPGTHEARFALGLGRLGRLLDALSEPETTQDKAKSKHQGVRTKATERVL